MCQKLTCLLTSETKDFFGVWEVEVLVNGKTYTFPISSEFLLRKFKSLLYRHKPGKALALLKKAKITGFNSFEGKEEVCNLQKLREGLQKSLEL